MLLPFSDPVATQTIRNFLKKPDELYMRYYVYNYFTNINKKDPGKAFKEFSQKIIEVNKLYTSRGVPGYETDRGVIYLKYGAPTDIITVENENGSLPYEIWQYNVLEQTNHKEVADAYFLFYKQNQATSDFRILHSTVEAEAKNMDWRSYLYPSGRNGDSRAEQYIGNK
jgi:GWxTD domain-containing protein